jgi:hypothetical protein
MRRNKQDRQAALRQWKAKNRANTRSKLSLPADRMQALFEMLDADLPRHGCDHTLRLVDDWCAQHQLPFGSVQAWLHENGGYCDCEALANAEEAWQEAMRDADDDGN